MKHLIENTFLLIIIAMGVMGMAFSFTSNDKHFNAADNSIEHFSESRTIKENDFTLDSFIKVKGIKEAGARMQFEVNTFNSNAHYFLDFGNGERKQLKNKNQQYVYSSPGDYNVKLFITYNGKTKLVHSEVLNIDNQVVASTQIQTHN
jgi:hypothetical protein